MSDIIKLENDLDLCLVVNKYSPKNVDYPNIALANGINSQLINVKEKISPIISKILTGSNLIKNFSKKSDDFKYVVDMSENLKNKIKSGAVTLVKENGNIYAQLKEDGKYSTKLPIKRELIESTGLSSTQMINSLQLSAMQNQLKSIKNEMALITESVKNIYIGQQNDRIALYFSGIHLYIEAQNVEDENLKKLLYAQSLKSFSDGICKLTLEMDENITHLKNKDFKKSLANSGKKLNEFMNLTNQSFAFIHQSYLMKAAIYSECGEVKALSKTLNEYALFLENTVNKNKDLLVMYDLNDDGTESGLWSNRSKLIESIKSITATIETNNEVILMLDGDTNE